MPTRKGYSVRLTHQAYISLSEKVGDYRGRGHKVSRKAIASEAINWLPKREAREKEWIAYVNRQKAKIKRTQEMLIFYVILVGVAGAVFGFITGVMI